MNLSLSSWDIAVFVAYLMAVVSLGAYASRNSRRTKRDYFLSGDKLSWWMIGGSLVASNISSHHLVGAMGTAYQSGFVAMSIEWGAILIGFNALLWIFLPFYLRNGFYTMPEFLQRRYGSAARALYAVLVLLTYVAVEISAVLYLGSLAVHSLLGINIMVSVVLLAVATGAYTIAGGLRAVIWTEVLQLGVLLAGGVMLAWATIREAGGVSAVIQTSDQWHMLLPADDPDFPWTMYLGGLLSISIFYCSANQFIVQRTLAARSEWDAKMGIIFADYLKFFMPLIILVPGLVAPRLYPALERPDLVFPTLVKDLLSPGVVGLVMAALVAAVMSHVSGAVNSCTTIATIDVYLAYLRKSASEAEAVRFGRIVGAVVIVAGILGARALAQISDKPIFLYLMDAYGYFTPGIATMFILGIGWSRTTHAGAVTAGLLTIPLTILINQIFPSMPFFNRIGIVFWICMIACVGVSLCTTPKSRAELEGLVWTRESMSLSKGDGKRYRGLHNPFWWWALVTAMVVFFYVKFP
jgi:SSS family solute:Na+ symporter